MLDNLADLTSRFAAEDGVVTRTEHLSAVYGVDPAEAMAQQFLLTRDAAALPGALTRARLGDWYLGHGADLPLARTSLKSGGQVAVLGLAVDREGHVIDTSRLRRLAKDHGDPQGLLDYLNDSAGRYVLIAHTPAFDRVYPDSIGSLGVVFDPETTRAGSTVNLVLTRDTDWNRAYPLTGNALVGPDRFSFGHTEDRAVRRLMPNHYLDLRDFSQTRHWPGPDTMHEPSETEEAQVIRQIVQRLETVISAIAAHAPGQVHLPMSGGLDSRVLLACARPALEHIHLFSHAENSMSRKDVRIATKLAARLGRPLRGIDPIRDPEHAITDPARLELLNRKHRIITGMMSHPARIQHEVLLAHDPGGIFLRGNGSDFLKAVLWRRGVQEYVKNRPHDPLTGIRMMMLSDKSIIHNPRIQQEYTAWYDTLEGLACDRVYDLMFAEHFLSHSFGNLLYGFTHNFYVCPFSDRRLLAWATSLPPDRRAALHYNLAIVEWRTPELSDMHYARRAVNLHLQALRAQQTPVLKVA